MELGSEMLARTKSIRGFQKGATECRVGGSGLDLIGLIFGSRDESEVCCNGEISDYISLGADPLDRRHFS